ncbi:MAG TPA: NAD(P)-dependent oxidoreductase [Alphaproteobacteria bacterium]|nr:NAD(P)-dependent oxidoreductase [Alphaproteobacteria bacterium]
MTTPLSLDLALLSAGLVGAGAPLVKRLRFLDDERVPGLAVYAPHPDAETAGLAGTRLIARLPDEAEVAALRVLFVAGLPTAEAARLAAVARDHRVLVNVEDLPPLCDFHLPAIVRRGDLAVSVSTGGRSPTLARRLRTYLETLFPATWAERTERIAGLRDSLRARGASAAEVIEAIGALIDREGWLPPEA